MPLLVSLLYLLLNIAIILLCAALIWWFLRWMGIVIDPWVLKICQAIVGLLIIILIVSWLMGALPPRGILGHMPSNVPGEFASLLRRLISVKVAEA
jgi:hypothetical protein